MLREPKRSALGASLCLVMVLSGCFAPEDTEPMADRDEEETMESPSPDTERAVFRIEVIAGSETSCRYSGHSRSQVPPEGFSYIYSRHSESVGSKGISASYLVPASVHAGPMNTGQATYVMSGAGYSSPDFDIENGSFFIGVTARFGTLSVTDGEPWVHVVCDSHDAKIIFYEADGYAAVYSPYATGGVGFGVYPLVIQDRIHVNHGDRYDFDTQGENIHVGLISFPHSSATMPYQTGHYLLETPDDEEKVDLDDQDGGILREYNATGSYGLYLERIAVGYTPFAGLMAGFKIHTQLGDLEAMPEGFYLQNAD